MRPTGGILCTATKYIENDDQNLLVSAANTAYLLKSKQRSNSGPSSSYMMIIFHFIIKILRLNGNYSIQQEGPWNLEPPTMPILYKTFSLIFASFLGGSLGTGPFSFLLHFLLLGEWGKTKNY